MNNNNNNNETDLMRTILILFTLAMAVVLFTACGEEYDFEGGYGGYCETEPQVTLQYPLGLQCHNADFAGTDTHGSVHEYCIWSCAGTMAPLEVSHNFASGGIGCQVLDPYGRPYTLYYDVPSADGGWEQTSILCNPIGPDEDLDEE